MQTVHTQARRRGPGRHCLLTELINIKLMLVCHIITGTTLTQEITYCVMTLNFEKANTIDLDDRFPIIDVNDDRYPYFRGVNYLANLPTTTPRMIKSHFHYSLLPDDITERKKGRVGVSVKPV